MGILNELLSLIGYGESNTEKVQRRAKRRQESETATRRDQERLQKERATKKDKESKIKAVTKLALIATTNRGIINEAETGRKKLLGN